MKRLAAIFSIILAACSAAPEANDAAGLRIVSVDYCADQYVLKIADRENIAALSPDADKIFSYMREESKGLPTVRPRAEDILLLKPDIVVRSYGGGPNAVAFFNRAGIKVVQIGYASDLAGVKQVILDAARDLGVAERGAAIVADMEARLAALPQHDEKKSALYLTSKGAVAGTGTMVDEMMQLAGLENFQAQPGWGGVSLERLAYGKPDVIAASFFDTSDIHSDIWTPARHPLAKRRLGESTVIELPAALTSCSGWPVVEAVERLAKGGGA